MLLEPTTIAAAASAMAQALESCRCNSDELFGKAGLDSSKLRIPGARYPMRSMIRLWELAVEETGDPCLGLIVARYIRPTTLHALGFSWLASPTLGDGLRRLARYYRVINTGVSLQVEEGEDVCRLSVTSLSRDVQPTYHALDAFFAAVVKMCRSMSSEHFAPRQVAFERAYDGHLDRYVEYFHAPICFAAGENALYFERAELDEELPAGNVELAHANDRIVEDYLETLDPNQVASKVRKILVDLLPSGGASQEKVAGSLHRSVSSLQRSLRSEGVSYREILEETRKSLARQYVLEGTYSLSQIAFLLGFSDQGNFSRAFKRWTGRTPREFRA